MKTLAAALVVLAVVLGGPLWAYPPAVGILGKAKSCLACHVSNGPWTDQEKTIVDILDKETGQSLRQADSTFLIEAKRGQSRTVVTVIGQAKGDPAPPPYRNAWLYVDPTQIETSSLSKFAPGWEVNLPMSCRIVGDAVKGYEGATVTALPMSIRPSDAARDATIMLQIMLTRGESVKGKPAEGMIGNYFERTVRLKVLD
jgi:hypothetical protein